MEATIAKVINQVLDTFGIQADFTKKNLDINIAKGRVRVSSVSLYGKFLNSLQLPFEVVRVMVDNVDVSFSALRLTSFPITVKVEGVTLLVRMANGKNWNMETCWEAKSKLVSMMEKLIPPQTPQVDPKKPSQPKSLPKFVVKILNRLTFHLTTLRVVLVDPTEKPVVCGFVLDSVEMNPIAEQNKAHHKFEVHKSIVVRGIRVFVDASPDYSSSRLFANQNDSNVSSSLTDQEIKQFMDDTCAMSPKNTLLFPITVNVQVSISLKPEKLRSGLLPTLPRITAFVDLDEVILSVSDQQLEAMINVMLHVHSLLVLNFERQWKPVGGPFQNREQWLEYGIIVHLSRTRTKLPVAFAQRLGVPTLNLDLSQLMGNNSVRQRYMDLYQRVLDYGKLPVQGDMAGHVKAALGDDTEKFKKLERSLSVNQILMFRRLAIERQKKKPNAKPVPADDSLLANIEEALQTPSEGGVDSDAETEAGDTTNSRTNIKNSSTATLSAAAQSASIALNAKLDVCPVLLEFGVNIPSVSVFLSLVDDRDPHIFAAVMVNMIKISGMLISDGSIFTKMFIQQFQLLDPPDSEIDNFLDALPEGVLSKFTSTPIPDSRIMSHIDENWIAITSALTGDAMLKLSFFFSKSNANLAATMTLPSTATTSSASISSQQQQQQQQQYSGSRKSVVSSVEWSANVCLSPFEIRLRQTLVEKFLDYVSVVLVHKQAMGLIWTIRKQLKTPIDALLPVLTVSRWDFGLEFGGIDARLVLVRDDTKETWASIQVPKLNITGADDTNGISLEVARPPKGRLPVPPAAANYTQESHVVRVLSEFDIWKIRRTALEYFTAVKQKQFEIQAKQLGDTINSQLDETKELFLVSEKAMKTCQKVFFSTGRVTQDGYLSMSDFFDLLNQHNIKRSNINFIAAVFRCLKQEENMQSTPIAQELFEQLDSEGTGEVGRAALDTLVAQQQEVLDRLRAIRGDAVSLNEIEGIVRSLPTARARTRGFTMVSRTKFTDKLKGSLRVPKRMSSDRRSTPPSQSFSASTSTTSTMSSTTTTTTSTSTFQAPTNTAVTTAVCPITPQRSRVQAPSTKGKSMAMRSCWHLKHEEPVSTDPTERVYLSEFATLFPMIFPLLKRPHVRSSHERRATLINRLTRVFGLIDIGRYGQVNVCTLAWALKSTDLVNSIREAVSILLAARYVDLATDPKLSKIGCKYLNLHSFSLLFLMGVLRLTPFEQREIEGSLQAFVPAFQPNLDALNTLTLGTTCMMVNSFETSISTECVVTLSADQTSLTYTGLNLAKKTKGTILLRDIERIEFGLVPGLEHVIIASNNEHFVVSLTMRNTLKESRRVFGFLIEESAGSIQPLTNFFSSLHYLVHLKGSTNGCRCHIETVPPANVIRVGAPLSVRVDLQDIVGNPIPHIGNVMYLHVLKTDSTTTTNHLIEGDCEMQWHPPTKIGDNGHYQLETRCLETGTFFLTVTHSAKKIPLSSSFRIFVQPSPDVAIVEVSTHSGVSPYVAGAERAFEVFVFDNRRIPMVGNVGFELIGGVKLVNVFQVDTTQAAEPPKRSFFFGGFRSAPVEKEKKPTLEWRVEEDKKESEIRFSGVEGRAGCFSASIQLPKEGVYILRLHFRGVRARECPLLLTTANCNPEHLELVRKAIPQATYRSFKVPKRQSIGQDPTGVDTPFSILQDSDDNTSSSDKDTAPPAAPAAPAKTFRTPQTLTQAPADLESSFPNADESRQDVAPSDDVRATTAATTTTTTTRSTATTSTSQPTNGATPSSSAAAQQQQQHCVDAVKDVLGIVNGRLLPLAEDDVTTQNVVASLKLIVAQLQTNASLLKAKNDAAAAATAAEDVKQ